MRRNSNRYNRVHYWLRQTYGNPSICESKTCEKKSTIYDWAIKKGKKHQKNRANYLRFCRTCHILYDWDEKKTRRLMKISHTKVANKKRAIARTGMKNTPEMNEALRKANSVPVVKIEKNGKRTEYSSMAEAGYKNGVTTGSVWLIVARINKQNRKGAIYRLMADSVIEGEEKI